jgi:hypothetical protein
VDGGGREVHTVKVPPRSPDNSLFPVQGR